MLVAIGIVAATFLGTAIVQNQYADRLPELVPTHWNIHMQPDGVISRDHTFVIFYMMPTLMAATFLLLAFALPWMSPLRFKVEAFRPVYDYIIALVMALFAYMHAVILTGQITGTMPNKWFIGGFFSFFGLMGNVLGKVRKNFWVGVRTPWTIASDVVWEKTHRLAAWLFVALGLFGFTLVMLGLSPWWCFALIIAAALTPVLYSFAIYKRLEKSGQLEIPTAAVQN